MKGGGGNVEKNRKNGHKEEQAIESLLFFISR